MKLSYAAAKTWASNNSRLNSMGAWIKAHGLKTFIAAAVLFGVVSAVSFRLYVATDTAVAKVEVPIGVELAQYLQKGISLLREKYAMTEAGLNDMRGVVNTHGAKLKSISEKVDAVAKIQVTDPQLLKILEALKADVEALKQETKTVPLLKDQMSELDTTVKTLGQRLAAEFRGTAMASVAQVPPASQVPQVQQQAPVVQVLPQRQERIAVLRVQRTVVMASSTACLPGSTFVASYGRCLPRHN